MLFSRNLKEVDPLNVSNSLIAAIKQAREAPPDQALSIIYQEQLEEYQRLCEKMHLSEHKKTHQL